MPTRTLAAVRQSMVAFSKNELSEIYGKRARHYDVSANLYYLLGFRESAYRKRAVRALNLKPGDTVVEIGCGTGLNFGLLRAAVGSEGRIVGVDLTAEMLGRATKRIADNHWSNIELVQRDAAAYEFPGRADGILSTFAITLMPEYDEVIKSGAAALGSGKRFVILDFKKPDAWPTWLIKFFVFITRPFGVSIDLAERHPWKSINRYLTPVQYHELYFGGLYICVGEALS